MRWGPRQLCVLFAPLLAIALACGEYLVDSPVVLEDAGAEDATDLGVATDEAGRRCTCLAPIPDGWTGPFVLDELSACEAPWSKDEPLFAELDAGAHECSCKCAAPPSTCIYRASQTMGACALNCGLDFPVAKTQSCLTKSAGCGAFFLIRVDGGGACAPTETKWIDDAGFQRSAHRCSTEDPITTGVCPNAAAPCVPEHGVSSAYCIEHEGESQCPPAYSVKHTFHRAIADTRDCSPCTCTSTGEPCAFVNHSDITCSPESTVSNGLVGLCTPYGGSSVVAHRLLRHDRVCAEKGAEPTGKAEPTGTVTVCCRPE